MSTTDSARPSVQRSAAQRLLAELVRIDSVNPDLVPGGAGEGAIAAFVAEWLRSRGVDVELDEAAPGRPSVIGTVRGTGAGRSLMLNAHIDTVGVEGMDAPFVPRVADGRMYGRGAYDMKSGLAAVMLAAAAAVNRGLAGDVILTAVADEEHASLGVQSVLRRWTADAAIVTEPTGLDVCVAHKGFVWFELRVRGRAFHGSQPTQGIDAIAAMGGAQVAIAELDAGLSGTEHPLLGRASVHAALIHGGQELSSYPEHCVLGVERRTLPGESLDAVRAEIERLGKAVDVSGGASVETDVLLERLPFEVDPDEPIVQSLRRAAAATLPSPPRVTGENPWMDAAFLAAAGIPTVVFGPGGSGAHSLDEWVQLDDVSACAEVLLATASDFCA
jgi:acetylornithine deacetylase